MMDSIRPRGDVEETLCQPGQMLGTQRLKIVDREHSVQPWVSADGRWALCYNGEVFNYRELRRELIALGHQLRTTGDTEVVLEAWLEWGEAAVHHLRGEFAFAVVERPTARVYLARDPVGVKPLYWSHSGDTLSVASEIKALVDTGWPITEVAPGHHGWSTPDAGPELSPYVDLMSLAEGEDPIDDPDEACRMVREALVDSIRVRVDTDLTVGVVLSGGLDSTLILLHVREMHPDCVAFTIGTDDSDDLRFARRLTHELGVRHEVVELRPADIHLADVRAAIGMSELTEYGDVINSVVTKPLFQRIHDCGVKVVLSGDGSDELFGGYSMYQEVNRSLSQRLFRHNIRNLSRTELQRVDRISMGQGVEARVPFLDLSLVKLALQIPLDLKVHDGIEKWVLRNAFADLLPEYVRHRPKNPMSHSSGLHERIRLYRPLFAHLYRSFGYDRAEPMRRDFSYVLERNQLDLDRTLTDGAMRDDYTAREHARDLIGAVRWNLATAARRRTRTRS
ncbi:MAG TPA: asparagine synthase-related protein [Acidimicrobiales bacterium]|jgi:asparagine synthase (glutamine-hydrolysing)|nr:asparagine synthase-related protein [Acidimicrobiales bacterium]